MPRALDAVRTLVFLKDNKLRIVDANQAVFDLLGLSREAVIGRTATELAGVTTECEKDDAEVLASGVARTGVLHQMELPGGRRWFLADKAPIIQEDGTVTGVVGTLTDVTEQMRLQSDLEEREAQLKYLTDNTEDIIWTTDLDFRTTYVSPSIERVLGFTAEEHCRRSLDDMVTPDSKQIVLETLQQELAKEANGEMPDRSLRIDIEYYCRDGSTRWLENIVTPIRDASGTLTGMLGVSRDVSELRKARAELEESEARMRRLARHLLEVRERERADIARDLHDQLGQGLTALSLDLYVLRQAIEKGSDRVGQRLDRIIAMVDGLTNDARTLSTELRPGMLDDLGLGPTVEWQVGQFQQRSGVRCTLELKQEVECTSHT
ncbi:MAG: PAS domain-containing sensor histidine kinase, partial [Chloroflexota bacterium]